MEHASPRLAVKFGPLVIQYESLWCTPGALALFPLATCGVRLTGSHDGLANSTASGSRIGASEVRSLRAPAAELIALHVVRAVGPAGIVGATGAGPCSIVADIPTAASSGRLRERSLPLVPF